MFVNRRDGWPHAADAIGLTHVQLHGDEGPRSAARSRGARCEGDQGGPGGGGADLRDLDRFHTDFHLLDTAVKGASAAPATWDWSCRASAARKIPLFLAGGLNPDNVVEAIAAVRP